MTWNHRVMAHKEGDGIFYQIHEVYYDENGVPESFTETGVAFGGESIDDLEWQIQRIKECLKRPIIAADNFPEIYKPENKSEPIMNEAFNKLMGHPMETIEALAQQAKEINRKRTLELNQRDLKDNGIERD